jgi:signal transduction histidine kinase
VFSDKNAPNRLYYIGSALSIILGLYCSSLYSFLLFHSLIEIITIAVAFALFLLIWNTLGYLENNYLRIIGISYGFIAFLDLLHSLAYKGLNVFPGSDANLPTQLWIVARYLQAITLFAAPLFIKRMPAVSTILGGYTVAVSLLIAAVFSGKFPDCFIDGNGLTPFKIYSEYVITVILIVSLTLFYRKRGHFNKRVFVLIFSSIIFTAASEISFTAYVSVYGFANMIGHFCKLIAFYLVYQAILVTGIKEPFELIFRESKQAEKKLHEYAYALTASNKELQQAYDDLKTAQARLLQQDKMASIGQLAAGVAHEINNPMGFIISNLSSLDRYVEKLTTFLGSYEKFLGGCESAISKALTQERQKHKVEYICSDMPILISESLEGAERVRKIVQDLKSFSRVDSFEYDYADVNKGLESTVSIVWNELKHKATVTKEYGRLPRVWCNLGQLNQVFMNILVNAAQAIESSGTIQIKTWAEGERVYINISDTGKGISAEYLNRVFDPFFTTKEVGKGTGLGLSIAYDIVVNKHGGIIGATSEVNKGSSFIVSLPIKENDKNQA